ncbi:MAG TPA: hypothetical protein VG326_10805 [Tepidisphaeraceae bacterium]|jgi:hypothetical protein|nr:hypothetical protein [Tepidisphaeraceae bacterium]
MKSNHRRSSDDPLPRTTPAHDHTLPPLFGDSRALKIAAGALLLATLLVFGLLLFNGGDQILSLYGADLSSVFVGWSDFTFGELAKGNLPLWNPHLYGGAPCLGGFQEALLYPPSWLHLILPMPQAFNGGIALHVFLAGFFTYLWMARRGLHPAAAVLAGLVFMFGGGYFMHISAGHLPNLRTMVWAPLIFLAIDDLTTTRSLRGAWLGAGAVAMAIYAGHVQYVYFTAVIAIPYALLGLRHAPSKPRALAGLALLGIGGAALSAVQLFTGLQAASESTRSQLPIETARTFAFPPENLVTAVAPHVFGQVTGGVGYWGRWFLWEDSLFIGMTALILAVYGAVRGEPKHRRFAAGFLVASLLLAFGYYTPLYGVLYRFFPGFGSFRGVSKFAFIAALFLANLSGVGFDHLLRTPRRGRYPAIFIAGFATVLAILAATIWLSAGAGSRGMWGRLLRRVSWSSEGYQYGAFRDFTPTPAFIVESGHGAALNICVAAGVCMLVAAMWLGARKQRRYVYAIGALATLELLTFAWQNTPVFDLHLVTNVERRLVGLAKLVGADGRAITGMPTIYMMAGGNDGWGNDPMVLRRYSELITYDQGAFGDESPNVSKMGPLWGLVRIKGALVPTETGMDRRQYVGRMLARAQLIDTVEVIENPRRILAALADPTFAPAAKVLLEKPVSPMPIGSGGDRLGIGTFDLKDRTTDEIEITADVRRASILLISDNYSSGWRVGSLDEHPVQSNYQVVRADYVLRGIPLMPGRHHLLLRYMPTGYVAGKIVTLVSLLIYIGLGLSPWIPGSPGGRRFSRDVAAGRARR